MNWDESVDFLVIGSGAAGMSAAIRSHDLGNNVLVLEKSDKFGGSTAMSGGVCWMANTPSMAKAGLQDNDKDALRYLEHITHGEVPSERLQSYLDESLRVYDYYQKNTHVRFDAIEKYTDYYPEAPGGRPGGRSMESRKFPGTLLGEELRNLRMPHPQSQIMGKFGITAGMAQTLLINNFKSKLIMLWHFIKYALRFYWRRKYGRDTLLYTGNALCARLRLSMMDRGIVMWRNAAAEELIIEDGRVVGAVVARHGKLVRIEAKSGVLLAAGGFSRNAAMRREYQRHPIETNWTAANTHNMGDGIRMGLEAGGALDLMKEAWWTPTTIVPKSELGWVLVVEKNLPGSIFVNSAGKRFTNEAAPYIDVVVGMYEANNGEATSVPCHMVFDADFRNKYPVGPVAPGWAMPDSRTPRRYRNDFLVRADTLAELAEKLEIDGDGLQETVTKFNDMAIKGVDEDFKRGDSLADRYYGDYRVTPNPCLAPIAKPPFYAIKVEAGDLGTKGGFQTDLGTRVLNEAGEAIPNLYAAGNCAASVMGRTYPGAGGTIGPALTFGFVAAESANDDNQ